MSFLKRFESAAFAVIMGAGTGLSVFAGLTALGVLTPDHTRGLFATAEGVSLWPFAALGGLLGVAWLAAKQDD